MADNFYELVPRWLRMIAANMIFFFRRLEQPIKL